MQQWVYSFGAGRNEGRADMKDLLGGKGANLAEMASIDLPVPPGFTITTEVCTAFYENERNYPEGLQDQVAAALARVEEAVGLRFGDAEAPLARLRALGRAGLHARHDGHRAQPRPQRPDRAGPGAAQRRPALRLGQLSPLHPDVWLRRARRGPPPLRGDHRERQARHGRHRGHRAHGRGLAARRERIQGHGRRRARRAVPAGPARPALGRDRRRVRLLDEPARQHLPPPARHPGELGHGGQRAGHGVRQHGRGLRHRRLLHPRPEHGRGRVLRRIPRERPGRGRGRRHPHAAAALEGPRQARRGRDGGGAAGRLRRPAPRPRDAGAALPRHAGHRVHRPAEQALHAADAQRQAHRGGEPARCGRDGRGRADLARGGDPAGQPAIARPAPASDARPERAAHAAQQGAAGQPRRRVGRDRVQRGRGGEPGGEGRGGDPRARRDQPRGHPRHARRARHPDDARRHDQPRRRGRARHGAALRRGRGRNPGGPRRADAHGRRQDACAAAT